MPDLLCAYRGQNILLEVKDGSKPPSERKLTRDQVTWIQNWNAPVYVVKNVTEALEAIIP